MGGGTKTQEGQAACLSLLQAAGDGYRLLCMYHCHVRLSRMTPWHRRNAAPLAALQLHLSSVGSAIAGQYTGSRPQNPKHGGLFMLALTPAWLAGSHPRLWAAAANAVLYWLGAVLHRASLL